MSPKSEKQIRQEKLTELIKLGIDPYPGKIPLHTTIAEARKKPEGDQVAVTGRITGIRGHGKLAFFDLESNEAKLQLFFKEDEVGNYQLLKLFDVGDYLWVKGEIFTTKSGELSLKAKEFQLLSKSLLPIPENWWGLQDVETRYRQRSLDFKTNPAARQTIITRSKAISAVRSFLDNHGFIEIQTPILQAIPGGAAAKPFVTHYNELEADFYLRISPELYLKRLVSGGFEQVYEIGPSFRNEGLSHMHNPEFTTCEFYWAYKTFQDLMKTTQAMVQAVVKEVTGTEKLTYQDHEIDFGSAWPAKKFTDLVQEETGIDLEQVNTFEKLKAATDQAKIKFENQKISVWAELADELYKKTVRPKIIQPTFVTHHPLALSPLAKADPDQPHLAARFQLVLAGGFELVNAYTELNDPIEQEKRFREQMTMRAAGWEEGQLLDENFVETLKFGLPPTAGWGMGIDRLVMILTNHHSIKEVIPFPTLRPKN